MTEPVRVYIERVKAAAGVQTDAELGGKLGYSKQAIATWRRRGFIPASAELQITAKLGHDLKIQGLKSAILRQAHSLESLIEQRRADRLVSAITIKILLWFINRLKNPPSERTLLSIGAAQRQLNNAVTEHVMPIFDQENEAALLASLTSQMAILENEKISILLSEIDLDGNSFSQGQL